MNWHGHPAFPSATLQNAKRSPLVWCAPRTTCCLTTELSGRPRCRLPHAEPANNLLATRVRPTIVHGPLQRVVRQHHHCPPRHLSTLSQMSCDIAFFQTPPSNSLNVSFRDAS